MGLEAGQEAANPGNRCAKLGQRGEFSHSYSRPVVVAGLQRLFTTRSLIIITSVQAGQLTVILDRRVALWILPYSSLRRILRGLSPLRRSFVDAQNHPAAPTGALSVPVIVAGLYKGSF